MLPTFTSVTLTLEAAFEMPSEGPKTTSGLGSGSDSGSWVLLVFLFL